MAQWRSASKAQRRRCAHGARSITGTGATSRGTRKSLRSSEPLTRGLHGRFPLSSGQDHLGGVMTDFLQLFFSGLSTGAIYGLAALGFTLLWQASGTINFAQGEFVMLPAFMMLAFNAMGLPLPISFLLT